MYQGALAQDEDRESRKAFAIFINDTSRVNDMLPLGV